MKKVPLNISIRKALPGEGASLTELSVRSKSYWGYSKEFMNAFMPELIISEDYLTSAPVFVALQDDKIVAFAGLSRKEADPELVFLFVEPDCIGKGFGELLWQKSLEEAKKLEWKSFSIICDPNAENFYLKLGAVRVGEKVFAVIPD